MTSPNENLTDKEDLTELSQDNLETSKIRNLNRSATTKDDPSFGWSAYAERVNGRFAMVGFLAILLIEALSNNSFLHWAGFLP